MGNTLTVCHCQNLSETGFYFNSFPKIIPKAIPAGIYLLNVNYRNTRARCEICSELTIKTSEWSHCYCSAVSIANFEHISCLVQVFLLLTSNMLLLAGLKQIFTKFFLFISRHSYITCKTTSKSQFDKLIKTQSVMWQNKQNHSIRKNKYWSFNSSFQLICLNHSFSKWCQ